ncbi:Site-specific DNA-methyltransferase [Planctomycetales bacterium 10988]|nr:Site-specific DNA-methyltransferase [Planctomycetales bacterium 10988]
MAEVNRYGTAEGRWSGVGPYYAMFPSKFAESVILEYTEAGDVVLDPFAGRGTGIYSASIHNRHGIGIEINPVGWVYSRAKLRPSPKNDLLARLKELGEKSYRYTSSANQLPFFFERCFTLEVRAFLLAARDCLNWRRSKVDWTLMALLLIHLHGKRTDSLSNQMRQTKSLSPPYAIRWWDEHQQHPPTVDPIEFMTKKIEWRYAKGVPRGSRSEIYLGDSVTRLTGFKKTLASYGTGKAKLLFTSPPYCGVTNYHYDQWLRLWLLGGPASPTSYGNFRKGKFSDREKYRNLLLTVFSKSKRLLSEDATVYVRTDGRQFTRSVTCELLQELFPEKRFSDYDRPSPAKTQTDLFTDSVPKRGETDLILKPR